MMNARKAARPGAGMLSQTAEYALRAAVHLARLGPGGRATVDRLAAELDVPRNYLSKTLHALARAGVLASNRGPRGGFGLARDPAAITLLEIVAPFDPVEQAAGCLLRGSPCPPGDPCAAHDRWRQVAERIQAFFRHTTLADLVRRPARAAGAAARRAPPRRRRRARR